MIPTKLGQNDPAMKTLIYEDNWTFNRSYGLKDGAALGQPGPWGKTRLLGQGCYQ